MSSCIVGVNNVHIKSATIFGFGKWVDYTIDFTDEQFICMYGDNESGKTTIQQFLLFMLFGMPPKKRAGYKPKTSGKMGGRLVVDDHDAGEFVIERMDDVRNGKAVCYTPDGQEHDEMWLQDRLQGMTKETYQSIFSFSAVDLLDIRNIREEDLGEVLLGIGMTGSNSIYALEKRLDAQLGELFKPFGKKPEINQQLATVDTLFQSLQQHQETEGAYRDKKEAFQQLSDELRALQDERNEAKDAVFRLEKQRQALPILKEYQHVKQQLAMYPDPLFFPEQGINRFEQLNQQVTPIRSELSVLQHSLDEYAANRDAIWKGFYDQAVYGQLESILEQKQQWLDGQKELDRYEKTIQKLEWQMQMELKQLDAGISVDDLQWLQLPFSVEKTWNKLKNDADQLLVTKEQLEDEHRQLLKEEEYLHVQKDKLQASLADKEQEKILQETVDQYHRQQQMLDDQGERTKHLQQLNNKKEKQAAAWLASGMIAAVIITAVAFLADRMFLAGMAGVILAASIGQWTAGKRSRRELEQMLVPKKHVANQVSESEKQAAEQNLADNEALKQELSVIQDKLRSNEMAFLKWEEKQSGLNQREIRLQKQITEQYSQYPFLKRMDTTYWPALFHPLKRVLDLQRDKEQQKQNSEQQRQKNRCFEERVNQFFLDMNWETTGKSVAEKVTKMENVLQAYRDGLARIAQYDQWMNETEAKQREVRQKVRVFDEEIANLMNMAGTYTEEAFLAKGKQLEEKQNYSAKMSELGDQLARILPGDEYETLPVMEIPDERTLESAYETTSYRIEEIEQKLEQKRQERADIQADLSGLESSESYSDTLHRYTAELEKLENLAEEWAVLQSAKEMLTETKRNYRRNYLEQVIEKTTRYFRLLTGAVYDKIYPPGENQPFQVEAHDGIRYDVNELSQGTVDQLYVSLRLGISEVMSQKHRLPFIIDDAFVHFDPARTKRMAALLSEVSKQQQIILFTCKPDVMEAAANVIRIDSKSFAFPCHK
ncbi:hypothetical protein EU245_08640 [Lentibacillus lipolyticus]|nr:hypothetical protein EU245_08640 [Lentibacillus lipolyticus]